MDASIQNHCLKTVKSWVQNDTSFQSNSHAQSSDGIPTTLMVHSCMATQSMFVLPHPWKHASFAFIACFHGGGKTNMTWLDIVVFVNFLQKYTLKCGVIIVGFYSKKSSLFKTSFCLIDDLHCDHFVQLLFVNSEYCSFYMRNVQSVISFFVTKLVFRMFAV